MELPRLPRAAHRPPAAADEHISSGGRRPEPRHPRPAQPGDSGLLQPGPWPGAARQAMQDAAHEPSAPPLPRDLRPPHSQGSTINTGDAPSSGGAAGGMGARARALPSDPHCHTAATPQRFISHHGVRAFPSSNAKHSLCKQSPQRPGRTLQTPPLPRAPGQPCPGARPRSRGAGEAGGRALPLPCLHHGEGQKESTSSADQKTGIVSIFCRRGSHIPIFLG